MSQIERLLEHREWLRDLSRRLVADANLADDFVQQTWLAAVERPPASHSQVACSFRTVSRPRDVSCASTTRAACTNGP